MKLENGYYIWNKSDKKEYLSKWFITKEFQCQCQYKTCVEQKISKLLIDKLDALREEIKHPISITSAFRCSQHQEDLRKKGVNTVVAKKSQHELGNAVDLRCSSLLLFDLLKICERYFNSIGIGINFLHVDLRPEYRRWKY